MPKASPIQSNFNSGEFSPLAYGRVDYKKYPSGMKTCLNLIPLVQGPVQGRSGTKFVAEVKDSSKKTRVVRFEFSTTQAYVIEFGNQYCRFYKDNAIITLTAQGVTGITNANPAVLTYSGADTYANGDRVIAASAVGMTQVNNREFTVANVNAGANTFELQGVDSSAYGTYTSGGTVAEIYEIATPYLEADLFQLKFTQSADTLYIAHPSYAPRKLTRSAHTSWTLSTITFLDGPYLATNTSATTITPSAASGTGITLTASASLFASTDVDRLVRIKHGSTWGYAKITAYTSATQVTADVKSTFGGTTASADWRLGVWSTTTGFPGAVAFFEDRLFWAGATSYPQRLDGSKSGDYENMAPTDTAGTIANDNAVSFTLNASDVNVIRWLADDEKGLLAGTVGGEWLVRPSAQSEALSPTNISAKRSTTYGSANVQPVRAGRATLFVQRLARKLRELAYVFEVDGFRAPDLTVLSEHVTLGGITEIAYQQEPQSIVWAVRADGILLGLTYEREQEVVGWHRHQIGGTFGSGAAVVESVAVIPSADGTRHELWMIVKRTINGGTKRYVEYMTKLYADGDAQADAFFVDSGLTYSGSSTATVTGLFHLEGQTVAILADGAAHPTKTVSGGAVTLDRSATKIHVGLAYNMDGAMLRLESGAADGTAQGKTKRIHRVVFRLHNTLGLKIGPDFDNLTPVIFRSASDDTNAAVPLFSGDKIELWDGDYDRDGYICWRQDQPLPVTVQAVMPQLHTQDG